MGIGVSDVDAQNPDIFTSDLVVKSDNTGPNATPTVKFYDSDQRHFFFVTNDVSGGYNSIAKAGDMAIIWSDHYANANPNSDQNGSSGLVLAPHLSGSTAARGIRMDADGKVGIGTANPSAELTVKGKILAEEIEVVPDVDNYPDYVFKDDYKLSTLSEVEDYIDANGHLPEIPSAEEIEKNGMNLGVMNVLLLKKVEELTLYAIEQQKQLEKQQRLIEEILGGNSVKK